MNRAELINKLIVDRGYETYLEIGVHAGATFNQVVCQYKRGVDPHGIHLENVMETTSDLFFKINYGLPLPLQETFDIVFIDGLHRWEQVLRDIQNSLLILNRRGILVVHDCNPTRWEHQARGPILPEWTGDVWKAIAIVRAMSPYFRVATVDTDWGCGLIDYAMDDPQVNLSAGDEDLLSWEYFSEHRKEILNLISVPEFNRLYLTNTLT